MAEADARTWTLVGINTYPVKGEAGETHRQAVLTESGLVGDRAKRHPLLVATQDQVAGDLRANLVVDMADDDLAELAGQELRIGDVAVRLTRKPSACEGLYAEPVRGGDVLVGDPVSVLRCSAAH